MWESEFIRIIETTQCPQKRDTLGVDLRAYQHKDWASLSKRRLLSQWSSWSWGDVVTGSGSGGGLVTASKCSQYCALRAPVPVYCDQ